MKNPVYPKVVIRNVVELSKGTVVISALIVAIGPACDSDESCSSAEDCSWSGFQPAARVDTSGALVSAVLVDDFNIDGRPDLVTIDGSTKILRFHAGRGDATFETPTVLSSDVLGQLVKGDFNGDGKLDVVAVSGTGLVFFGGNDDGSFDEQPQVQASHAQSARVIAGELTGDALDDVLVAATSLDVRAGSSSGLPESTTTTSTQQNLVSLLVADLNADGRRDVVTAGRDLFEQGPLLLTVWEGSGDGTFVKGAELSSPPSVIALHLVDGVTGNKGDLVAIDETCGAWVYAAKPDGSFGEPTVTEAVANLAVGSAVADFDGDLTPDLACSVYLDEARKEQALIVRLGGGSGKFDGASSNLKITELGGLAVGDFNGDGATDIVSTYSTDGTVQVWLNGSK